MTYKDFLSKTIEILGEPYAITSKYKGYTGFLLKDKEHLLVTSWRIGGLTGGTCWGGEPDYPVSSEPEPETWDLITLLEKICPNISFIAYKALVKEVVKKDEYSEDEYYGNYTNYARKTVNLEDLYNFLCSKSLL